MSTPPLQTLITSYMHPPILSPPPSPRPSSEASGYSTSDILSPSRDIPSKFLLKDVAGEQDYKRHLLAIQDEEARQKDRIQQRLRAKLAAAKQDIRTANWNSIRKKLVETKDLWEAQYNRATKLRIDLEEVRAELRHEKAARQVVVDALKKARRMLRQERLDRVDREEEFEDVLAQLAETEYDMEELAEDLRRSEEMRKAEEIRREEERGRSTNQSNAHECNVCCNADSDALFPCGHVYCCVPCAHGLRLPENKSVPSCPVCRADGPFKKIHFA